MAHRMRQESPVEQGLLSVSRLVGLSRSCVPIRLVQNQRTLVEAALVARHERQAGYLYRGMRSNKLAHWVGGDSDDLRARCTLRNQWEEGIYGRHT